LFLEELQSDWAQQGRDQGFKSPKLTPEEEKEYEMLTDFGSRQLSPESNARMRELSARKYSSTVPSGPYVQDTKDWTALALKHALKQATDEGHDYLGWTTGKQQADRYDLSKRIDALYYNPETKELQGHKGTKTVFDKEGVEPEHLDELVGKDVAAKLTTMSPNWTNTHPEGRILSGLDLQVGGEGMKGYYDQIVPQTMNDVLKQIGAKERVKTIPLNTNTSKYKYEDIEGTMFPYEFDSKGDAIDYLEARGENPGHYAFHEIMDENPNHQGIEITPELRQLIQDEGLPHFHSGGDVDPRTIKRGKIKPIDLEMAFKLSKFKE
jgi:hypothetical protein